MQSNAWVAGNEFKGSLLVASKRLSAVLWQDGIRKINPKDLGNVLFCMLGVRQKTIEWSSMRDHSSTKDSENLMKDLQLGVVPKCLISTLNATVVADIHRDKRRPCEGAEQEQVELDP